MITTSRPSGLPTPTRPIAAVVIALVLLVAACSGGEGDTDTAADRPAEGSEQPADEGTTTTEAEPVPAPYEGYGDHEPAQYAGTSNWICHPDLEADACEDLTTTVVEPDGTNRVDELEPAEEPAFDCFYVYPTVSSDPTPASDLAVDDSETGTVRAQAARYASQCRVFAPAYRQITLAGLGGGAGQGEREQAYADVLDAWKTYVVEANGGRGVVLLGHSQGAGHLRALLAEEIDTDAELRSLLVSAVLLGTSVAVPEGEAVGGDLQEIPACDSADSFACVVSYSSYPAEAPPAEGAIFGRAAEGERAICVDPAELLGEDGPVSAVLPTAGSLLGGIAGLEDVETPYVSLAGAVRTACEEVEGFSYLSVALADPADPRPVAGLVEQRLGPTWGLHLLDANVGQDALIELVTRQAAAHATG